MLKKCKHCGKVFEATNGNKKLCEDCKCYRAKSKPKVKKKKVLSILEMSRIIEAHNHKYHAHYTYGEFEKLMKQQKIFILDGESFEKG